MPNSNIRYWHVKQFLLCCLEKEDDAVMDEHAIYCFPRACNKSTSQHIMSIYFHMQLKTLALI